MSNKLILGTVQMGLDYGINNPSGKIKFDDCCQILKTAFEKGITTLDTAEAYGNAHQVIGAYHRINSPNKFKIITKMPHDIVSNQIDAKIENYLKELNVERLEVLMFHSFEAYKNNRESIDVLMNLKSKNKIKHLGVSVYTNEEIGEVLHDNSIDVVQLPFNLLDNEIIRGELILQLKAKGKIVHSRSAFLQGLFFKEISNDNPVSQALANELTVLKNIALEENTTMLNLALSYCLKQGNIDNVLIGVDSVAHLEENLNAVSYTIPVSANNKIKSIKVQNKQLLNPSLWNQI
ncbi:aldo/keto reductase [Flavobacterium fluviale]|uniref:NADP-dependent oxidoreductase domain-containing protein n=1 Tax=Flavobacterium fluviale TaxID=2249356 RepID=A0A344LN96_9FLAO|nr:aldo/keto reductase [Flavobacterium fluviale]AXB55388.1 hypothetical protein HYN86_01720 [Flavobacterium fluviale]